MRMKQYASKRIILPVSILAAGFLASLFIAGSGMPTLTDRAPSSAEPSDNNLSYRIGDAFSFSSPPSTLSENLTERLASELARGVAQNDPETLSATGDLSSLVASIDQNVLNSSFTAPLPSRSYTRSDIRVSNETSREAQLRYFARFAETNAAHFKTIPWTLAEALDLWTQDGNTEPLERYRSAIPGVITDLLAVTPPENLAVFHLQTLNFWERTLALYAALLDLDDDPVRFLVALREAPSILDEAILIQNAMDQKIKSLTS